MTVGRLAAGHGSGDRGAEDEQKPEGGERRPRARRDGEEKHGDCDLGEREPARQHPGEVVGSTEGAQCVSRTARIEEFCDPGGPEDCGERERRQDNQQTYGVGTHAVLFRFGWCTAALRAGLVAGAHPRLHVPIRGLRGVPAESISRTLRPPPTC